MDRGAGSMGFCKGLQGFAAWTRERQAIGAAQEYLSHCSGASMTAEDHEPPMNPPAGKRQIIHIDNIVAARLLPPRIMNRQ